MGQIQISNSYKMEKLVLALLIIAVTSASAQVGAPCHNGIFTFTPRHSLNLTAFSGTWFAQEYASSYIGNTPEPDYKCLRVDFTVEDELHYRTKETYTNVTTGFYFEEMSRIEVNATRSPLNAVWTLSSDEFPWTVSQVLLAADLQFSKWAVLYGCSIRPPNAYRQETVTLLSRARIVDEETRQFAKALMVGTGFRIGDHWPILQSGCLN